MQNRIFQQHIRKPPMCSVFRGNPLRFQLASAIVALAMLVAPSGHAEDVEGLVKFCAACHGSDGVSTNPSWPHIAGQNAGYAAEQLRAYRDGKRKDSIMAPTVVGLSDRQIDAIAAWYESLPPPAVESGVHEAGRHVSAHCISCHGRKGLTVNTEWPDIAGQNAGYLAAQLRAYRDQTRPDAIMSIIVKNFTNEQIDAVAKYYSQLSASSRD